MIKVDLITGFLGAGKTTFLLRYARYLLSRGEKLGILVYDHGAVNVDMPMLAPLRGDNCELEMLSGACDADCHRRRFRSKLITMGMAGYDRVIIEPSGVFDMDEFFDTVREPPLDRWYEPNSVVAVVDARLEGPLSGADEFFLASQAVTAGCVLFSRTQLASAEELSRTRALLAEACESIRCPAPPEARLLLKPWDELTDADFARLERCGWRGADYVKTIAGEATGFESLSFLDLPMSRAKLEESLPRLFSDARFGRIRRVKGFFAEDGTCYQLNATPRETLIEPVGPCRGALILIGTDMDEEALSRELAGRGSEHRLLRQ